MINCKVSIIIPIYNSQKYIRDCINSVMTQTLRDIEIICIDDGSTDNTAEILKEFEELDDRIIVLKQKNSGQAIARNNGIDKAKRRIHIFYR